MFILLTNLKNVKLNWLIDPPSLAEIPYRIQAHNKRNLYVPIVWRDFSK